MIHLARSVPVSSFEAEATVAVGRQRPEFLAVARLAADLGRPIGAQDVLRELLGARPEVLGRRVIERCVGLGMLEPSGNDGEAALSHAGRLALEHGEVLVPEEGIWRFFLADDPLIPNTLIHAHRLDAEPVRKARDAARDARTRGERLPATDRAPEALLRCSKAAPIASVQTGSLLQLQEVARSGAGGPRGDLRLVFTWGDGPLIRLSGRLELDGGGTKPFDARLPVPEAVAQLSHESLWRILVTHATQVPGSELELWQATAGNPVLPVAFSSLPPAARKGFRLDLEVPACELNGMGRFEPTSLKGVGLVPASDVDAQEWLGWLQWEAVNDYVTPALLEILGGEQRARFPHHQPRVLSAAELLARAHGDRNERSWFLLGPSDLGLWS